MITIFNRFHQLPYQDGFECGSKVKAFDREIILIIISIPVNLEIKYVFYLLSFLIVEFKSLRFTEVEVLK